MNIRARLQTFTASLAAVRRVREARIGVGYSAVLLDNGHLGIAYTFLCDRS